MAMVTMRKEDDYYIAGFTGGSGGYYGGGSGTYAITPLALTPQMTLDEATRYTAGLPFGGTDCALPMIDALAKKIPVDVFLVITDSETWQGSTHASVALQQYRKAMGIDAKLIVMGVVANSFTIADPNDAGSLDVIGFDAAVPNIIAQFVGVEDAMEVESEE